ncbi:MAG: hypothetical protein ACK56F_15425, partial [bacterium]
SCAAPVRATGTVWKRQTVRPVHHVPKNICLVTLLQPARRAAVLGQPSSLQRHWYHHRVHIVTRDETGSVYLPTQLERTLQLYW